MHTLTLWCRLKDAQKTAEFLGGLYTYLTALKAGGRIGGYKVDRPPPFADPPPPAELGITIWGADRGQLLSAAGAPGTAALDPARVPVFSLVDAVQLDDPGETA